MAEERKKYDKEFKLTVVEVSFARGKVKEVAEEYGIQTHVSAKSNEPIKKSFDEVF